jgi:hypothetical protein
MNVSTLISRALDKLAFNLINAPDYPDDVRTDLDQEERTLRKWLDESMSLVKREDIGDWLRLGDQAIVKAFECFRKGEEIAGCRALQSATEYLENAISKKSFKVDFIARADGTVENAPEE